MVDNGAKIFGGSIMIAEVLVFTSGVRLCSVIDDGTEPSFRAIITSELFALTSAVGLGCMVEDGFITGLDSKVFTKVNVPNLCTGLSPLNEPSVLFVRIWMCSCGFVFILRD